MNTENPESRSYEPAFGKKLPAGEAEEKFLGVSGKKQYGPTVFYIEESDGFSLGKYHPGHPYRLLAAESIAYDNLKGKKISVYASDLYLSKFQWDKTNNGMLNFRLYLTKPIHIAGQGPVKPFTVDKLDFALAFKDASEAAFVRSIRNTPIFRELDIDNYLSGEDGLPMFDLEIALAKSEGTNSNTVIDTVSKLIEDKTVGAALSAVPYFGVGSAIFRIIRDTFFSYKGQAKEVWPPLKTTLKAKPGPGFPLKVGRYAIVLATISLDKVVSNYSYMGGRLVDNLNYKEVEDADQFYLDMYAS